MQINITVLEVATKQVYSTNSEKFPSQVAFLYFRRKTKKWILVYRHLLLNKILSS